MSCVAVVVAPPLRSAPLSSSHSGSTSFRQLAPAEFQEYTGHAQLTVTGPVTGVVYRFQTHGQRVSVHGADAASLYAIPSLTAVR